MPPRGRSLAFAIVCVAACGSKPDRAGFAASWKQAAGAKDGSALFALADDATQAKLRAAIEKTRGAIGKDDDLRALVAKLGAPPSATADAIAGAMLSASADAITDDGKTTAIHLEDGKWRASLTPYGFTTADGAPIHAHVRLATDPPPPPATRTSYEVHVDYNGLTIGEVLARHHDALAGIAKGVQLPPSWLGDADAIVAFYANKIGSDNFSHDLIFDVGADGSLTVKLVGFDRDLLHDVTHTTELRYGDW